VKLNVNTGSVLWSFRRIRSHIANCIQMPVLICKSAAAMQTVNSALCLSICKEVGKRFERLKFSNISCPCFIRSVMSPVQVEG